MGAESQFGTSRQESQTSSSVGDALIGAASQSAKLFSPSHPLISALAGANAHTNAPALPAHAGPDAKHAYELLLAAHDDPQRLAAAVARVLEVAETSDVATATQLLELAALFARVPVIAHAVLDGQARLRRRQQAHGASPSKLDEGHGADEVTRIKKMPVLHFGSHGPDVMTLKSRLLDFGFQSKSFPISENDQFDGNTRIAVRKFQWSRGLDVDGVVGQACWLMLLGHSAGRSVDLDDPGSAMTPIAATPGHDAALAAGQKRRKEWQDWGAEPPTNAKPGDYGDGWAMTFPGEIRVGGHTTWRYCNPGNILPGFTRHYSMGGIDAVNVAQPSGLAMFATMESGWTALRGLLRTVYASRTMANFTEKYLGIAMGQQSDFHDDPKAYRDSVGAQTGIPGSRVLSTLNDDELLKLMHAINNVEGNQTGRLVLAGAKESFFANAFAAAP